MNNSYGGVWESVGSLPAFPLDLQIVNGFGQETTALCGPIQGL